jgi:hypothetical protein
MSLKNLYLTIPVGQSIRDYLVLGIVQRLLALLSDFRIVLLTPSYNVPEFRELCPKDERLVIRRMELVVSNGNGRLIHWRRKLFRSRASIRWMINLEASRVKLAPYLASTFEEFPPTLVVTTHPLTSYDYEIVMEARRRAVQTVGVVKSWDNVGKGFCTPPHRLSVWNSVNKEEAVRLLGYLPEEVDINGPPSFDPYYDPAYKISRCRFFNSLGLDPARHLIVLATSGVGNKTYYCRDETHLVDDLLKMIGTSDVLKSAQLVIRLHPVSRLEHFWKYWNVPDIKFSFASYMPGITWYPSRKDLIEQAALLRYGTVIVTPGSSWTLEAAAFDTPTVAPAYSDFQPDHASAQFGWALDRHFKPIATNNWVPLTHSYQETRKEIEEAFTNRDKYSGGRKAIVENYICYQDGRSCQRVAQWIADIAHNVQLGKTTGL